ncbi:hypothetical protein [Rhizohabitans arisaemae]|uniref:hypothetical protein n=1 Tax=Rhizohabitans arisaemae TaxID=2720610 RepID=UPI0024B16B15|nr:hypothetical protein [Rhizohabitans arisaemae]
MTVGDSRGNRMGLLVVGLILVAAGGFALGYGVLRPDDPILPWEFVAWLEGLGRRWFLVATAGLLLMSIATRWLLGAFGWGWRGSRTSAGTELLEAALKPVSGVRWVQVTRARRLMRASISCDTGTDLGLLRSRLDGEATARVRLLSGDDRTPVVVRVHVSRRRFVDATPVSANAAATQASGMAGTT